ncbi:MAG: nickel-dependent hydrogenase large subunit [Deltaproteobacteria bacterium]|nr:nickel-dependent hydrogenase large subunit [Deltaproteobacteria bacterium]
MAKIVIDPITRIEGHLKVEATVDGGEIKQARCSGMLFRGFEKILAGRDPRDAQIITQRICGVCNHCHTTAAALNLDAAFGIADRVPDNGRHIRNLTMGFHQLQDHILHFYHLAALDYVDVTKVASYEGADRSLSSIKGFISRGELAPFVPRYEGDYRLPAELDQALVGHYVQALEMRRKGHEATAILGGKLPHACTIAPGGATEVPSVDKIAALLWRARELRAFVEDVYLPDVLAAAGAYSDYFEIGAGCGRYLSYGLIDLDGANPDLSRRKRFFSQGSTGRKLEHEPLDLGAISEHVKFSWYADETTGRHPFEGETRPQPDKAGGYSWLKAPRYRDQVFEVGPLARIAVSYAAGVPEVVQVVDSLLAHFKAGPEALFSVLGRHAARALCAKLIADKLEEWILALQPGEPAYVAHELPAEGRGVGIVDAARGALGHWIEIADGKIDRYQCVVPTTWNASPADDAGRPGPIEQALIGTKVADADNPFEIVRIVRSFDPCIACAVHLLNHRGRELRRYQVA